MSKSTAKVDSKILAEAAEWLVEMQEGDLSPEKQQLFEAWKNQGSAYQHAWQQAEQLQHYLNDVPQRMGEQIFDDRYDQQLAKKFMFVLLVSGGMLVTAYYAKQDAWLADQRTTYGEQRRMTLDDDSIIILNSKTAIDVDYTAEARNITLHYGEIYIQTAKDKAQQPRPFKVLNDNGSIQALGTQFNVEQHDKQTHVAVLQHAVLIKNLAGQSYQLNAGQQTEFNQNSIGQVYQVDALDLAWRNHLIVADRMPIAEFSKQIQKHYGISVELDTPLQNLIISGTYPSNDLDDLIKSLSQAYQLNIEQKIFPKKIIIYKK